LILFDGGIMAATTPISEFVLPKEVSSANAIAVDMSGNVWFAEKVGKNLAMFDPEREAFSVYPLPVSWGDVGPSRIALSPRGDIWFTVRRWAESVAETNLLGRFRISDNNFRMYRLPDRVVPEELVVDASGVVWFLAPDENKLYRFKPAASALNGYPIPTQNAYPRGIAIDGKGSIWFAEANANKLGRFVLESETFYEFVIPTPFANPGEIAVDGDGKIWFVELTSNRIGVFYPDLGRFDEALIPTPQGMPNSIVVDGTGNLWFLEYRGNKVSVFNSIEATFREYDIPTFNSLPGDLAIDPDRAVLWFSETSTEAKRLGKLSIKVALMEQAEVNRGSAEEPSVEGDARKTVYAGFLGLVFFMAMAGIWFWYSRKRGVGG